MAKEEPAFPVLDDVEYEESGHVLELKHPGMSLRDWFAGQALASGNVPCRVETTHGEPRDGTLMELMAVDAYAIADAMLAERAKSAS